MDIFLCGKPTVKAHLCTLLSSACRVGRQEYLGGTPCFCFSIQGVGGCARWLPIGSSYPLDDVCGAVPSAAEHTALKEAFFQPKGKSSMSSDPAPSLAPTPSPSPHQLLPALLPLALVQVLHVAGLGQVGGGPLVLSSEETCFSVGRERVGVGRVEQKGGGVHLFHLFGGWVKSSHWRGGNKSTGALSHAPVLACVHL